MSERWRIKKERLHDRKARAWGTHEMWNLYLGSNRVARYQQWQMCMDHIQRVYAKWPNFGVEA